MLVLDAGPLRRAVWALSTPALWALGWAITSQVISDTERQYAETSERPAPSWPRSWGVSSSEREDVLRTRVEGRMRIPGVSSRVRRSLGVAIHASPVISRRSRPVGGRCSGTGTYLPVRSGVVDQRPEHTGVGDPEVLAGQHIIGAQIAGCAVGEVGGVECGSLRWVTLAPPCRAACSTAPSLDGVTLVFTSGWSSRMLGRSGDAVAVERVGVVVAGDDELRRPAPGLPDAVVVVDVAARSCARARRSRPRSGSRRSCGAVAILGAVEHRWCRMAHQEVDGLACRSRSGRPNGSLTTAGRVELRAGLYQSSGSAVAGRRGAGLPACLST